MSYKSKNSWYSDISPFKPSLSIWRNQNLLYYFIWGGITLKSCIQLVYYELKCQINPQTIVINELKYYPEHDIRHCFFMRIILMRLRSNTSALQLFLTSSTPDTQELPANIGWILALWCCWIWGALLLALNFVSLFGISFLEKPSFSFVALLRKKVHHNS